ncbi:Nn.00g067250.m01.CDS01 [Neocucurbitaria sp. VM-36]
MAEHEASLHDGPPPTCRQSRSQTPIEPLGTGTKRSLFRGKKGKRLSETVTSSIGAVDYQEPDAAGKRTSVLRKGRRQNNQSESSLRNLRHRISSPFDFQHLTHTDRHQFAALEKASGDKLAADLWAVSASQSSGRGLTGIRADDLHFSNFSSEDLATAESRSTSALGFGSPPRSPETDHEWQQSDSTQQLTGPRPSLRLTRSVESFSQPGVSPRNHRHSQSVVGPPRFSSLPSLAPIHDAPETHERERPTTIGSPRSKRESGLWDSFALGAAITPTQLPGLQEESAYFGHALSTPDDSAVLAMTPPFSPSLEDVDEEPERFVSPRPAPLPPVRTPTTPRSPQFESFTFSNQRSPAAARSRARGNSHTSPKSSSQRSSITRPMSQMSDTLGSANLARRGSIRRPSASRRRSNTWRAIEESWEDDVDYIYENALEADCDFEWDRASDDGADDDQHRELEQTSRADTYPRVHQHTERLSLMPEGAASSQTQLPSGDFRTSLLVPSSSSVPDLVPTSAISTSTTGTGLPTPSDPFNANRFIVDEGFALSPSLLVPQEYKDTREVTYEDLLNEYDGSDRHFPMLDSTQSMTSSARSSHVRSSRRSSYDSSFMSSAQSSGLWSSPIRRSASSAGSVPELVPSRRTRKDITFSLVVDQLSEQVASLRQDDEDKEDDDVTPPGRSLQGRTFFSSEEELPKVDEPQSAIESELKTSLELARRGSQRSDRDKKTSQDFARQIPQNATRAPLRHHKQALSDGAAKILATASDAAQSRPTKLRNRAATTNGRQPMLSLFPTPPRHTPSPNQI